MASLFFLEIVSDDLRALFDFDCNFCAVRSNNYKMSGKYLLLVIKMHVSESNPDILPRIFFRAHAERGQRTYICKTF